MAILDTNLYESYYYVFNLFEINCGLINFGEMSAVYLVGLIGDIRK